MKKKEIKNGRKHAYAHGLHCVNLYLSSEDWKPGRLHILCGVKGYRLFFME